MKPPDRSRAPRAAGRPFGRRSPADTALLCVGLLVLLAIVLGPIGYAVLNSLRPPSEILEAPHLISRETTADGYREMWEEHSFNRYFLNSFVLAAAASVIALLFGIPGAYAVARLAVPGSRLLFYLVGLTIMFPWTLLTLPLYVLFTRLGLYDTFSGLLVALTAFVQPFNIWVLTSFFRGMPRHLEEAAMLDGCTRFGAFVKVILPLASPALVVVAFFSFYQAWNNFLLPFMLTTSEKVRTATVGITTLISPMEGLYGDYNVLLAAGLSTAAVPVAIYFLLQRYVLRGISYAETGRG